ncbi:MAG: 4-hydroxythreonine-4-phosphate dehydrogenase PdxA [Desulfobulbaceae bacterium]|nr:4-hydroxythreonine-4-phosphate dehydrogenase PdxA [Desulfobulbaceae bacterium]
MPLATPLFAITMGCPVGIGPEIIVRYFAENDPEDPPLVVVGDMAVLRRAAEVCGLSPDFVSWQPGDALKDKTVPVLPISHLNPESLVWGQANAATGQAAASYITAAVRLIEERVFAAMITAPISKKALHDAGYPYPGHTEMLAALTKTPHTHMMLAGDSLKVMLVTIHCPLKEVAAQLNRDKIFACINACNTTLRDDFALVKPRLAVAALNPHAGEDGLFGDEEERLILPAIVQARAAGIDVHGPLPPDTVFHSAANGQYDAVICMYHDQGLIPFKLLHFKDGVNVTCGLPIVRTSVDHGTAYDIAGSGQASHDSLAAAIAMAGAIAQNRRDKHRRASP